MKEKLIAILLGIGLISACTEERPSPFVKTASVGILPASLMSNKDKLVHLKPFYYVNAKRGLSLKSKPSQEGETIGKVRYGEKILVLKKTAEIVSFEMKGKTISGEWYQVQSLRNKAIKGYVCSGFLVEKSPLAVEGYEFLMSENKVSSEEQDLLF